MRTARAFLHVPGLQGRGAHVCSRLIRCHASLAASPLDLPTIFALSTGAGRSAVAVVRLTGPLSGEALASLAPSLQITPPKPRLMTLAELRDPRSGEQLDRALVAAFPGPRSFTGEDCVELHLHGGPAVVRSVLSALSALPGLRPAEPGEFTRRAFEAGKLDLTEVEGLADLLAAETEAQRRQALVHAGGAVRRRYEGWRARLLSALASVEAVIDFGEEEGIADEVAAGVLPDMRSLRMELLRFLAGGQRGQLVRGGVRVALVGPPNAGKSSLLNALSGRDAAIVSPFPGTTRDVLELDLELGGHRVILADCAGIRDTEDPVEAEGVRRARATLAAAHIVVQLRDAAAAGTGGARGRLDGQGDAPWRDGELSDRGVPVGAVAPLPTDPGQVTLWVLNKSDLLRPGWQRVGAGAGGDGGTPPGPATAAQTAGAKEGTQPSAPPPRTTPPLLISCATGEGLDALLGALGGAVDRVLAAGGDPETGVVVTRARHAAALSRCVEALARYEARWDALELAAEELRGAMRALGAVSGVVDTEEVLDTVFAEFCIGK